MKSIPKVIGLIQARNEWPLLALSISHALMYHVDEVYVLNHASTDRSIEGLEHLQKLWNNRIHVFHWYDERYQQEVCVNALVMISKASSPDWFYIFDADEFLLAQKLRSLKSIVNEVDPKYSAIRYEVQNWISTEGFDNTNLNHYRMLRYRSVANSFIEMYPSVYADEILNGNLNFFDVPFLSKFIFRNDEALWVEAGTHGIRKPVHFETLILNADGLRAAHFPLLSRRNLDHKVRHGQRLIQDGFPATHGWQNQMIYRFAQQNKLDEFWQSHTISSNNDSNNRTLPSFVIEDGFTQAIEPVLCMLEKSLDASLLHTGKQDLSTERPADSLIPFSVIIPLVQNFRRAMIERDEKAEEIAKLNQAISERDAAVALADLMRNNISWRITMPLRFIARLFRYRLTNSDKQWLSQFARKSYHRLPMPVLLRRLLSYTYHNVFGKFLQALRRNLSQLYKFRGPAIKPAAKVEELPDYIIWGIIDWHFRHQRPQQLALALANTGRRVFYISANMIDDSRCGFKAEQLDVHGMLFQIKLFVRKAPSIYTTPPTSAMTSQMTESIGEVMDWANCRQIVSMVQHPFWCEVASVLPNSRLVYDCMDHHEGFGNTGGTLVQLEKELFRKADLTITTSAWLERAVEGSTRSHALIRNAADYTHFSKVPESVYKDSMGRRIIGYYGAIAEWFDQDLVEAVAKHHPGCCVLLIGADTVNAMSRLGKLPNVKFIGEVAYDKLPYYLHSFDVCLLPFKVLPLTLATNPVKAYEYLSAGKPVIALNLPEMAQFDELIYVAADKAQFLNAVDLVFSRPEPEDLIQRRKVFAQGQTWKHRVEALIQHAESATYDPKVSIIVVTYNNIKLTQACLASIDEYSQYANMEIIVVDNASSDGTPAFLENWVSAGDNRKIILNDDNRGFAPANNQGLNIATGDYLVLLNNDTYVTPGWIRTLVRHLQRDRTIGLIGPVTNNIGNEAKIGIAYEGMSEMLVKSASYTRRHIGQLYPLRTAGFFCVMMSRETFEKVGPLDEAFEQGFFEDDDYCRRIEKLGLRIVCAEDVFIHHKLSAAFDMIKQQNRQKLFEKNKKIYEEKWGEWIPHVYRKHRPPSLPDRLVHNVFAGQQYIVGQCIVCGKQTRFFYKEEALWRESLNCENCRTTSRYRSITRGIIRAIALLTGQKFMSLADLPHRYDRKIRVYDTQSPFYYQLCAYPLPDILREREWFDVVVSDYKPDRPLGKKISRGIINQNLETLTFPDNTFDIVITSDVMEHVRLDDRAHREIYRVLKPGGIYIFTVPHNCAWEETLIRVQVNDPDDPSKDIYLMEPEYHGDANNSSSNGILAYRTYGRDIDAFLCNLGFEVEYSREDIKHLGILNTELYYCRKVAL